MMIFLAVILAINAALHGLIIVQFGTKDNLPVLVFAFVYAALTLAIVFAVPYAPWATLVLSIIGFVGLTVAFGKIARDKAIDRLIWVLDAATIAYVVYLLLAG